ncbi:protoporphyrinogen oxidase [Kineococcus aurantiacus]|uniref:Coproporphyrinogen III oxidase n=1 Tax=Kineococcus aurantiacus TaxID=37633 RepID=A0A7Y9DPV9_9ACTN|nr:oxygen-dependent protoporphyrinogen oxidase [Kineococcus aurantiacus]
MARVVVVGAGVSGLTAAWQLAQDLPAGDEVEVLEAAAHVGGVLQRRDVGGLTVDVGAESVLARRPEATGLAAELGLDLVHPATTRASLATEDGLRPLPAGTVMGVPRTADSVRGLLAAADVDRVRDEPSHPAAPLEHDVSVARYVADRVGPAVVDRLVEPLLGGVYAGHAAQLSLRATVPALWAHARRGGSLLAGLGPAPAPSTAPVFAGLAGGLARLPLVLAERLRARGVAVRTGTPVTRLERTPTGWLVDGTPADAVVLAVPAPVAARLLAAAVPAAAAELREVVTAGVVIAALAVPAGQLAGLAGSGVLVPPVVGAAQGLRAKALTLSGNKWDWVGRQSRDLAVLRVSLGRAGEGEALEADDADVVRWAAEDAGRLLGRPLRPVDHAVVRWADGLPQYAVGHVDRVARLRAAVAATGRLAVCGSVLDGVGVPACVAAARRAAAEVTAQLAGRPGAEAGAVTARG